MNEKLYIIHKNFHTKLCMFTAPDTHTAYIQEGGFVIMVVLHLRCIYVVCNALCLAKPVTCVVSFVSSVPCYAITAASLYCDGLGQVLMLAPSESLTAWC